MIQETRLGEYISLLIIISINFIFGIKYLGEITKLGIGISCIVALLQFLLWYYQSFLNFTKPYLKIIEWLLLSGFIIVSVIIFRLIKPESLMVDRWSVITSFWDNFFSGKYVYYAKSHMGNFPGPMPFYYCLALPFYIIGELGYLSVAGILLFNGLLRYSGVKISERIIILIFTATSLSYIWEIACRSNLFINATIVLFSMVYLNRLNLKKIRHVIIAGILSGLVLSTRNVFVMPYIILFLFFLKYNKITILDTFYLGFIALVTFSLTFLPFVINHIDDFMVMNPFIIQSSFLMPFEYSIIFIGLSFGGLLVCKKETDVYLASGLILFFTILFYCVYHIIKYNFQSAFYESVADISYFLLCFPFFMYYIAVKKLAVKKYSTV